MNTSPQGKPSVGAVADDTQSTVSSPTEPVVPQTPVIPEPTTVGPVGQNNVGLSEDPIASETVKTDPLSGISNQTMDEPTEEPANPVSPAVGSPSINTAEEPPTVEPVAPKPENPMGEVTGDVTKMKP